MNQRLIEESESASIKLEELHLVLIKRINIWKEKVNKEAQEQYELYKWLNPRFFEEGITPKDAFLKIDSMNPKNLDFIRSY